MESETWNRCAGYFADSGFCFSNDGRYVLCPCGPSVQVISATTGERVTSIGGSEFHGDSIVVSVECFDFGTGSEQLFASLDVAHGCCIWKLHSDQNSNHCAATVRSRFTLDQLQLGDQKCFEDLGNVRHVGIETILACSGHTRSLAAATLILVLDCCFVPLVNGICAAGSSKNQASDGMCSEDSRTDDDQDNQLGKVRQASFIHVVELRLADLFQAQSAQSAGVGFNINVVDLFHCCCRSPRGKAVAARRSVVRAAACESHVVLVKNHSLFIWDRSKGTLTMTLYNNVFSSVTLHKQASYAVTGDASGNITWWKLNFLEENSKLKSKFAGAVAGASPIASGTVPTKALQTRRSCQRVLQRDSHKLAVRDYLEATSELSECVNQSAIAAASELIQVPVAVQHWHSHPVRALAFMSNGLHLASAGEEAVLVFWHVSQSSRHFMPRFGAPIHGLVSAPAPFPLAALTLADNSLRIIDVSTSTVKAAYYGLQLPLSLLQGGSLVPIALRAKRSDIFPMAMQFFSPQHPSLALTVASGVTSEGVGANSRLQVFDVETNTDLGHMSVNNQNFVSRTDAKIKKYQWTIQIVAMAPSGKQLATLEFRKSMFPAERDCLAQAAVSVFGSVGTTREGQLISLDSTRGKSEAQVKQQQRTGSGGDTREVSEHAALNFHGHCSGNEHISGRHYVLKFWSITPKEKGVGIGSYTLVTEVLSPHFHDVTALLCKPSQQTSAPDASMYDFVSLSLDSTWKLWRANLTDDATLSYTCVLSGSYRGLPCLAAGVSMDQSLLAIAHPNCVSIWDTVEWKQLGVTGSPQHVSLIPPRGVVCVGWIETSENAQDMCWEGERLLMIAVGAEIWIWNMASMKAPKMEWATTLKDSTAVAIPSIWGTPMFAAVSRSTGRTASLYRVVRKAKDDVEKRDVLKCNVYQVIETAHTSQLLFSCGFFGKVSAPQFYFLDSRFELHVHPLPPEKPKSAILAGKKLLSSGTEEASSLEDAPMATEDLSSAVTCAAEKRDFKELTNGMEDHDHVNFGASSTGDAYEPQDLLSEFILGSRPASVKGLTDPNQVVAVVGQSRDGASHLVGTPSMLFSRMVAVFMPNSLGATAC